jgi:hypothetical protein
MLVDLTPQLADSFLNPNLTQYKHSDFAAEAVKALDTFLLRVLNTSVKWSITL